MITDNIRLELYRIIVYGQYRVHTGILPIDSYYERCYDTIVSELERSSDLFTSQLDDEVWIEHSYGTIFVSISGVDISGHKVTPGLNDRHISVSVIILILLLAGFNPSKIYLDDNEEFSVANAILRLELFAKLPVSYCNKLISRINQNYVIDRQVIIDTIDNLSEDDIEKKLYFIRYLHDNYDFQQQMEKLEL